MLHSTPPRSWEFAPGCDPLCGSGVFPKSALGGSDAESSPGRHHPPALPAWLVPGSGSGCMPALGGSGAESHLAPQEGGSDSCVTSPPGMCLHPTDAADQQQISTTPPGKSSRFLDAPTTPPGKRLCINGFSVPQDVLDMSQDDVEVDFSDYLLGELLPPEAAATEIPGTPGPDAAATVLPGTLGPGAAATVDPSILDDLNELFGHLLQRMQPSPCSDCRTQMAVF